VRIHKFAGGTIVLQMRPFSVPSGVAQDAKIMAAIADAKFDYLIIRMDTAGRIVDYHLSNGYEQAEAYYLAKVKTDTNAELAQLKPGKTKLKDGKVIQSKAAEVKPLIIER